MSSQRTIAIINTERIGDSMIALPALRSFLEHFPGARSILVTDTSTETLFSASGLFSKIYTFRYRKASLPDYLDIARSLKREHVDTIMLLPGGFFAAFIAYTAGIPVRAGLSSDMRGFMLTHKVRPLKDDRHRMHHYLDVLGALGIPATSTIPKLTLPEKHTPLLPASPLTTIAIAPFTRDDIRRMYPLYRWKELVGILLENKYRVVVIGSPDEALHYRTFLDDIARPGITDCVGKYRLLETAYTITECQATIANDSGLMHLSAALGTPTVALFGATRQEKAGPIGPHTVVVESTAECRHCDAKKQCAEPRCMEAIEPAVVIAAVEKLLKRR
ncbi:MAG: glycosyltransferase family 9 protein [Spirochaetes bacterium]|nr:glycosyltransferase family 9 protein [Spirochaetota bacterium]